MRKTYLSLATVVALALPIEASARKPMTVESWIIVCDMKDKPDPMSIGLCVGYMNAVLDAASVSKEICIPERTAPILLVGTVHSTLKEKATKELMAAPVAGAIMELIEKTWPCNRR